MGNTENTGQTANKGITYRTVSSLFVISLAGILLLIRTNYMFDILGISYHNIDLY